MSSATTGNGSQSPEDTRTYQSDLWRHKIPLKLLRWSVLVKWFAVNLVLSEWQYIPGGQFNCQPETTSQQPRCQRGYFFLVCLCVYDVQILHFAIMQHHRIDCVWRTVFHNIIDVPRGTQREESSRLGLDLRAIEVASPAFQRGAEHARHERARSGKRRLFLRVCRKSTVTGHIIRQ